MDTTKSLMSLLAATLAVPTLGQTLTVVNEPWPGEATHAQMLADAFGGTFTSLGTVEGVNFNMSSSNTLTDTGFTNGSFTALRVADSGSGMAPNLTSLATGSDAVFAGGSYDAVSLGGFSSLSHDFGYINDAGDFTRLVSSTADAGMDFHPKADFEWAMQASNGATFSSDSDANEGRDHMVSYAIYNDQNEFIAAVLFFEDFGGNGSDWDYNDFSVLLTLAPTPQAAMLGLAGLGGIGLAAGRRRR
ncbi:MAG: hypothetical protein AAFR76_06605 [Planctomycetota bacterium]